MSLFYTDFLVTQVTFCNLSSSVVELLCVVCRPPCANNFKCLTSWKSILIGISSIKEIQIVNFMTLLLLGPHRRGQIYKNRPNFQKSYFLLSYLWGKLNAQLNDAHGNRYKNCKTYGPWARGSTLDWNQRGHIHVVNVLIISYKIFFSTRMYI